MTAKNDTPKPELLPCPFCGGNAKITCFEFQRPHDGYTVSEQQHYARSSWRYKVECESCRNSTKSRGWIVMVTAVGRWNRRA